MMTCTRRLHFCAGHRVWGHANKCGHFHGHNFIVLLSARAEHVNELGIVIDFSLLKDRFGGWIEREWDHGFILNSQDEDAVAMLSKAKASNGEAQKLYLLDGNPTAENLADHLLRVVGPQLLADTHVTLTRVDVWETENCAASAEL